MCMIGLCKDSKLKYSLVIPGIMTCLERRRQIIFQKTAVPKIKHFTTNLAKSFGNLKWGRDAKDWNNISFPELQSHPDIVLDESILIFWKILKPHFPLLNKAFSHVDPLAYEPFFTYTVNSFPFPSFLYSNLQRGTSKRFCYSQAFSCLWAYA